MFTVNVSFDSIDVECCLLCVLQFVENIESRWMHDYSWAQNNNNTENKWNEEKYRKNKNQRLNSCVHQCSKSIIICCMNVCDGTVRGTHSFQSNTNYDSSCFACAMFVHVLTVIDRILFGTESPLSSETLSIELNSSSSFVSNRSNSFHFLLHHRLIQITNKLQPIQTLNLYCLLRCFATLRNSSVRQPVYRIAPLPQNCARWV